MSNRRTSNRHASATDRFPCFMLSMNAGIVILALSPLESVMVYGHTSNVWTMMTPMAPDACARRIFCANVHVPLSITTILPCIDLALVNSWEPSRGSARHRCARGRDSHGPKLAGIATTYANDNVIMGSDRKLSEPPIPNTPSQQHPVSPRPRCRWRRLRPRWSMPGPQ
jgi:hypothetical protein